MRFKVDGQQYRVVWRYDRIWDDNWLHRVAGETPRRVRATWCWVNEDGTLNKVCAGAAQCSEQDAFDRKIGRKLALTRALKSMPREFRRQACAAYLEMQGGQW